MDETQEFWRNFGRNLEENPGGVSFSEKRFGGILEEMLEEMLVEILEEMLWGNTLLGMDEK